MCPHGYHHSGSMVTPALETRDKTFNKILETPTRLGMENYVVCFQFHSTLLII